MKCFVIMPFGNPTVEPERANRLEYIYCKCIKPCVEAIEIPNGKGQKLTCHRADKEAKPGDIIDHIIENLVDANIVIADLSGRNPNVFYELGVRHAVGVSTILVADNLDDIPFDLRTQRAIAYKYDPPGMQKFSEDLQQAIKAILASPPTNDNPVRKFLYQREVSKLQKMTAPPGYDAVKEVLGELANLRAELTKHASEVREIVRSVSASATTVATKDEALAELRKFEGVWKVSPSGSLACARIINGQLLIPYCYGGDRESTGHYFNCKVIAGSLFTRFEWLAHPLSGVGFYKLVDKDRVEGGWWMDSHVPESVRRDATLASASLPGMAHATWNRVKIKAPEWAEEYFRKAAQNRQGHQ